jgi:nitrile hydratase
MGAGHNAPGRFHPATPVRVRELPARGHVRTPAYIRGKVGVIERDCGDFPNPEDLAHGRPGLPRVALYRVRFRQASVWRDYQGGEQDTLDVEIFAHWLEPA